MASRKPDLPQDRTWAEYNTWTPPSETTLFNGRRDASYWTLVDRLMHLGWYRLGQRPGNDRVWGFRRGYTLPDHRSDPATSNSQERWIAAFHEKTAMRRLLREVQGTSRNRRVVVTQAEAIGNSQTQD
jgi:hypothetical protein